MTTQSGRTWAAVLSAWSSVFGSAPTTCAAAVAMARTTPELSGPLAEVCQRGGELSGRALGYWLRSCKDQRCGNLVLRKEPGTHGVRWFVEGGSSSLF
jgi:hypothetical protein